MYLRIVASSSFVRLGRGRWLYADTWSWLKFWKRINEIWDTWNCDCLLEYYSKTEEMECMDFHFFWLGGKNFIIILGK